MNASLENMMTERLHAQQTFEGAVATLLHDVVALHGAEFGDVQLPIGSDLVIVAQLGLGAAFLQAFKQGPRGRRVGLRQSFAGAQNCRDCRRGM